MGGGGAERAAERIVRANGTDLCVQTFGDAGDPAILLIGGGAASMDWWEDEFCSRLAAGRRFVIRYDHRDTGRSVSYPPGEPPYTVTDLAADAAGILDALGVARAHLACFSVGGVIALRLALGHPERVASLTLISTTPGPGGPRPGGPGPSRAGGAELPPMSARLQAHFAADSPPPDWSDRAAVIELFVAGGRPMAGSRGFDERHLRALVGRVFDRTRDMEASVTNHALIGGGEPVRPRLGEVSAPALVIHGTEDPLYPYGHAEALAREIPRGSLIPLPGIGHQMPPPGVWDLVIPAILSHTSGGEQGPPMIVGAPGRLKP